MKNQKNAKNGSRSRRKTARKAQESVVSVNTGSAAPSVQLLLPLADVLSGVHESVEQLSIDAGLLVMKTLIEEEVERRAGKRGKHDLDRQARRWGSEDGTLSLAARRFRWSDHGFAASTARRSLSSATSASTTTATCNAPSASTSSPASLRATTARSSTRSATATASRRAL